MIEGSIVKGSCIVLTNTLTSENPVYGDGGVYKPLEVISIVVSFDGIISPATPKMVVPCFMFDGLMLESISEVTGKTVIVENPSCIGFITC